MDRKPVSSSNLRSVGFDPTSGILEIEFKNGSVYQYDNVPFSEYRALMSASSHGKYFSSHIKKSYTYRKIS